ncbi:conjugal transfer protein [Weissella viridescens]|uniref:conjugal transfer protein n=1 Tax=Weissella viridescens TaxID=1629 RepID=UPI003AF27763
MKQIVPEAYEANEYNFEDIAKTQPDGNLEIYGNYTKLPNGYAQILYVEEVKASGLRNHWLADLASKPNTILNISTGVEDKQEFIKRLDRTDANVEASNGKLSDDLDNSDSAYVRLMHAIKNNNHQPMRVYIRLVVYAETKRQLKQNVRNIVGEFPQFKFKVLRDFQFSEWRAMWMGALQQFKELDEHQMGLSMSSADLGGSFWADYQKLEDPYGSIIGTTFTGGLVNFNMYYRDDKSFRTRPFTMILGSPNFGKSTLQKMLLEDSIMRGNRSVVFDPSNEYGGICDYVGGITVPLDGSNGHMINPFQIFPTVTDETGEIIDERQSFNQHLDKLKSIYSFMSQGLSQQQLAEDQIALNELLTNFYIDKGMWPKNPRRFPEQIRIMIPDNEYPTLGEFLVYLGQRGREVLAKREDEITFNVDSLSHIQSTFKNMQRQHGEVFDGYTTMPDLSEEMFVRYDVANLLNTEDLFNAMTYMALAMEQPNIINNGKRQRLRRQREEVELYQVPHTLIVLEEAQNYLASSNAYNLNFIVKLMEQMRKNYAAVMMAMPTLQDVITEGVVASNEKEQEYQKNIKKMFDLIQYRFFFNLPNNNLDSLGRVLGDSVTPAELSQIANLAPHRCMLNIQGDENYFIYVGPSKQQLKRFNGGD